MVHPPDGIPNGASIDVYSHHIFRQRHCHMFCRGSATATRRKNGGAMAYRYSDKTLSHMFRRGLATARKRHGGVMADSDVVVVSFARTPIASVGSKLSSITAPYLGSHAIKGALSKIPSFPKEKIQEAFMGNVLSAGQGQAPTRQAILYAGLEKDTACTTGTDRPLFPILE